MLKIYDFHIDFQFPAKKHSQGTSRHLGSTPDCWNGSSPHWFKAGINLFRGPGPYCVRPKPHILCVATVEGSRQNVQHKLLSALARHVFIACV